MKSPEEECARPPSRSLKTLGRHLQEMGAAAVNSITPNYSGFPIRIHRRSNPAWALPLGAVAETDFAAKAVPVLK